MQGIQFFEYKYLLDNLQKLKEEEHIAFSDEHNNQVMESEKKLKHIYEEYRLSLVHIADIIRQFEEHKLSVRRLVNYHKSYRKLLAGKKFNP
ncbi:MAG: hypothetical protein KBF74_09750 [Ferruginibacter sp.]|nr:hypothetical protein [Ferruginibacter sp.]